MRNISQVIAALAALLTLQSPAAASVRVQPMSYDLGTSGSDTSQDLRVENTGDQPMPVELFVDRREILPDGSERRTRAEEDFFVFPPQAIVPPNSFQTFRVQYIGDPTITQTKLYLVTVSQLPVDTTGQQTNGVQFLFNLGTLAAVSPRGARAELRVIDVRPSSSGADAVDIRIRNDGNGYARLRNGTWILTSGDGTVVELEHDVVRGAIRQGLIEPGTERVVRLPVGPNFVREGASATFQLNQTSP